MRVNNVVSIVFTDFHNVMAVGIIARTEQYKPIAVTKHPKIGLQENTWEGTKIFHKRE